MFPASYLEFFQKNSDVSAQHPDGLSETLAELRLKSGLLKTGRQAGRQQRSGAWNRLRLIKMINGLTATQVHISFLRLRGAQLPEKGRKEGRKDGGKGARLLLLCGHDSVSGRRACSDSPALGLRFNSLQHVN